MREVEFWYDIVCPYAYLASTQIERVARDAGARVRWEPFLLGGVFIAIGAPPDLNASMPENKRRHNMRDMQRWAAHFGVRLEMPAAHPRRTVLALRALLAAGEAKRPEVSHALFRAYWAENLDIADPNVVREVLDRAGVDGSACVDRALELKNELRRRTDLAVSRGIFGAPAFFVGEELFWGQDRLDFVARALATRARNEAE